MTYYRLVQVPRIGYFLPAHFEDDTVIIVPRFKYLPEIVNVYFSARAAELSPCDMCTDTGRVVRDASPEEVQNAKYFDCIINLYGDEAKSVWESGEDLTDNDEDYPTFHTLAEVIR